MLLSVAVVHSFSLLCNIPFYEYTVVYFCFLCEWTFTDGCLDVFHLGLCLGLSLYNNSCTCPGEHA